jgi:ribulose-5-phosphate 4-epimerase/fuculose-1-phosphate aldolase
VPKSTPLSRDNRSESIEARVDLAAAFRCAARLNMHEGVCNHFSVMLPGQRFLINPKGTHFERMTASGLIVIDEHGKTLEGTGRPPMTAIRGGRLEMIHQNAARFFGQIAYDDHFNGIAVQTNEGDRMAAAMGDKRILFLANHGVVVVGENIARAFDDFYYLERACQVQVLAMQCGRPLNVMSDEIARLTHEQFGGVGINAELHFTAMKKILDDAEPSYAS